MLIDNIDRLPASNWITGEAPRCQAFPEKPKAESAELIS